MKTERCMTQADLAERWQISEATLERWRTESNGPLFLKLGNQVRYRVQDVEAFEEVVLRGSTKTDGGVEHAVTAPRPAFRPTPHVAKSARPITIWLRTGSRNTRLRPLAANRTLPR
jgi:Helix-turn-helix domain